MISYMDICNKIPAVVILVMLSKGRTTVCPIAFNYVTSRKRVFEFFFFLKKKKAYIHASILHM